MPKASMDVTSNKSFIHVFHRAANILCSTGNKSLQAEMKKGKVHKEKHTKKTTPKPTKKQKNLNISDCQTSRCCLKNKSSSLNGIAATTGTICLFNVLAKKELHEALVTPGDLHFHRGKHL